jgi:EAL domain-containing protein (putative c-di-GMP-specific phosphodiesterase class I)
MSKTRRSPNVAVADLVSVRRSRRLAEIVRSGLSSRFQPIYPVGHATPFAVEGFIRGPVGNALECPDKLFQSARMTDMTLALDEAAYRSVLATFGAMRWPGKLFLNIRPSTLFIPPDAVQKLRAAIVQVGLHPSQVILELTEQEPVPDAAALRGLLDPLFDEGMELSLDDVGSGYANMRLLCELKPHFIKVDKFFVAEVAENPTKQSVIRSLVNIACEMGATTIAEGVERQNDAEMAIRLGIDMMQGHLFASTI